MGECLSLLLNGLDVHGRLPVNRISFSELVQAQIKPGLPYQRQAIRRGRMDVSSRLLIDFIRSFPLSAAVSLPPYFFLETGSQAVT